MDDDELEWEVIKQAQDIMCAKQQTATTSNSSMDVVLHQQIPLGLRNNAENVCFGNVVIQALYALPEFRAKVENCVFTSSSCGKALQRLFNKISTSTRKVSDPVTTSTYFHQMGINGYEIGRQYDSHEFLTFLLDEVYQEITDNCMFRVDILDTVICEKRLDDGHICGNEVSPPINSSIALTLNVDTTCIQSISDMLQKMMMIPEVLSEYKCDECSTVGQCYKTTTVTHLSDALLIQFSLFRYTNRRSIKLKPRIIIDDEISFYGSSMTLHSVIYHSGQSANTGHYTCTVKVNNQWFSINDNHVREINEQSVFNNRDSSVFDNRDVVPYIVIYKKIIALSMCLALAIEWVRARN